MEFTHVTASAGRNTAWMAGLLCRRRRRVGRAHWLALRRRLDQSCADLEVFASPIRAVEALITLLCVLFVSTLALLPDQSARPCGLEIAATGLLSWFYLTRTLWSTQGSGYENALRPFMNQAPPVPFVIGGVLLALGPPSGALLVPGVLLCFPASVLSTWARLVEIQR